MLMIQTAKSVDKTWRSSQLL